MGEEPPNPRRQGDANSLSPGLRPATPFHYPPESRFLRQVMSSRRGAEGMRIAGLACLRFLPPSLCASAPLRETRIWLRPTAALCYGPQEPCLPDEFLLPPSPDPTRHHVAIAPHPGVSGWGSWRQRRHALEGHDSAAWGKRSVAPGKPPLHLQAESRRHPGGGLPRGRPVARPEPIRLPRFRVADLQPARTVVRPSWGGCPRLWNCGLSGRPEAVHVPAITDPEQGVA